MTGYRFNPFSKPLAEFSPEELNLLRDVSEGWFVDYKSAPLAPKDFGKHLSAFANQFGGWLFVGVKEGPHRDLKAESFPGIPTADVGATLVKIREGVSAHVSPPFYFDHRVIDGPVDAIGLDAGKSIVIVGVPEGPNPPFVHSSGKIYRRIADQSEPKAETDRAVLDSMWRKSDENRMLLQEFILKPADEVLSNNPFCHVYLLEDLTFSLPEYGLTFSEFREAMQIQTPDSPSIPLDNLYPTQDGFIGRHLSTNNPTLDLVALRWWQTGNVRFTIPINFVQVPPFGSSRDDLLDGFIEAMGPNRQRYGKILNLDQWAFVLLTLTIHFINLRDKLQSMENIYGKIVFSHARTAAPFIGMESYLSAVKDYGIPVIQDSMTMFPAGIERQSFSLLTDGRAQHVVDRSINLISPLLEHGLRSLGIDFAVEKGNVFGLELAKAMDRAIQKQPPRQSAVLKQPRR